MDSLTKVSFTNLEKILYPVPDIKKSRVLEYYIKVAPRMLKYLKGRPIVMNRFPDGIDVEGFYEKDASIGTPTWVETFVKYSETAEKEITYILCNDLDTLLWMANLAAIEINITLSEAATYEKPDLVLFDIDPEPPADFDDAVEVALLLKEKLDLLDFKSYVKTSGKKGLHIVIPISGNYAFKQTREFVHLFGKHLARESEIVVSEFSQGRDPGTVFIDYMQNVEGKTMIAPYSLRANEHAPVSTPLFWDEVRKGLRPQEFNIFTVLERKKDPWEGLMENRQKLELG
jgi:bifunctional non-homologous end joining protein LigD